MTERSSRRPRLVERLLDPAVYPHPVHRVELIETHISWVLLVGDRVYKVKKPVALGFLDFTTLARRRASATMRCGSTGASPPTCTSGWSSSGGPREHHASPEQDRCSRSRCSCAVCPMTACSTSSYVRDRPAGAARRIGATVARFHAAAATGGEIDDSAASRHHAELGGELRPDRRVLRTSSRRAAPPRHEYVGASSSARRGASRARGGRDAAATATATSRPSTSAARTDPDLRLHRVQPPLPLGDVAGEIAFLAMDLERLGRPDLARASSTPTSRRAETTRRCRCSTSTAPTAHTCAARCRLPVRRPSRGGRRGPGAFALAGASRAPPAAAPADHHRRDGLGQEHRGAPVAARLGAIVSGLTGCASGSPACRPASG